MYLLEFTTAFAYFALNVDILLQIRKIWSRRSSKDISIAGMFVRFTASMFILLKFFSLNDRALMVGQTIFVFLFTIYIILALRFNKKAKKRS